MPQRNKRQYIKPGTGTKFRLVNRSIRDLGGYEVGAGANVLAPIDEDLDYDDLDFDQIKVSLYFLKFSSFTAIYIICINRSPSV